MWSKGEYTMSVKSDNFKRISENRVKKINDLVSKLHNLINPSFYEYTDAQVDNMFKEIQDELDRQKAIFEKDRLKGKRSRKLWKPQIL